MPKKAPQSNNHPQQETRGPNAAFGETLLAEGRRLAERQRSEQKRLDRFGRFGGR